jgi:peptidoglycan/xylan/chitin deacetylase (PgdA/CDA1 family)
LPPVLCYHRVGGPLELGVTRVPAAVFERQVSALARDGWRTLTLAEYEERLTGVPSPVPRHELLLTFDDGYATLAEAAYPVLARHGFTAVTFLVTDHVGRTNTWDARYTWRRLPHLDWDTVARWRARGFAFGSHGATHRRLTWLGDAWLGDELERSRAALRERVGEDAGTAVAYPFGAADARVVAAARAAGYRLGFGGVRTAGRDPLERPRAIVYAWDAFAPPLALRGGPAGALARTLALAANRCSVGTSVMLGLLGSREPGTGSRL